MRFKCKNCKKTFSLRKKAEGKGVRYFGLFKKWINTGNTVKSLIELAKVKIGEKQLLEYFHEYLGKCPSPEKQETIKEINLKIDAKYLGRWGCCLVFKERKNVIYWQFCERETYLNYIYAFSRLKGLNYEVLSITSDEHGSTVSSVKAYFKGIRHQYCLVHIELRCKMK